MGGGVGGGGVDVGELYRDFKENVNICAVETLLCVCRTTGKVHVSTHTHKHTHTTNNKDRRHDA